MTKQEILLQFTSDELRAEIKRRNMEKRREQENVPRCRNCKHYGTIGYHSEVPNGKTSCCPYKMVNSKKHYRVLYASDRACEHYQRKDDQL